jgi:hypothetical protein
MSDLVEGDRAMRTGIAAAVTALALLLAGCGPIDGLPPSKPGKPPTTTTTAAPTSTSPPPTTTTSPTSTTNPTTTTSPTTTTTTATTTPTTTTTPPVGQECTDPVWESSDPDGMFFDGGYIVHNNMWNAGGYDVEQTIEACSWRSWNVTATADNSSGDGAVKTFPNTHKDWHNWSTGHEPPLSDFPVLRSTFAAKLGPQVGIYNVAFDIWLNGVPGNREIMIWTENHNQRPAGSRIASGLEFSGITWDVWATSGNGYIAFVAHEDVTSGELDLREMLDYLIAQGRVPADSTLGQIGFGVEVVSTDGAPATFEFLDFSVADTVGG